MNLAAVLEERACAAGWGERPAFRVRERAYSFADVHDGAARAASMLSSLGAVPGGRVLIALDDGIEFVWAFLGALRTGALAVPVNPRLTAADHAYVVGDARPAIAVCKPDLAGRFAGTKVLTAIEHELDAYRPLPAVDCGGAAPAYAQYTSGTTGPLKGAVHRHSDPLVYFDAFARRAIDLGQDDVVLSVSKLYFAYGLGNSLFFPLLGGACAVLNPLSPTPGDVARLVARHRVTVLFSVPTFYAFLAAEATPEAFRSLRVAVSAGESLVPALAERSRQLLGCPVLDGLGSTEVGQTFVSNTLDSCQDGTIGTVLPPYEIAIRDIDGHDVAPGIEGALWVRGPTTLIEYIGKPAATAQVQSDGWLRTGDLALVDHDGFVHHRGRSDDMEMVGGISVAPLEIERLLCQHPDVTELAVAAVRDAAGASRLVAFVVLHPNCDAPERVAGELIDMAGDNLAPYKVPREVRVLDALPRTPTGKLRRFLLRSESAGTVSTGSGPGSV